MLHSWLDQPHESPCLPPGDLLKDPQTINSQHFLSALPHFSALISVKNKRANAVVTTCWRAVLGYLFTGVNRDTSQVVLIIWLVDLFQQMTGMFKICIIKKTQWKCSLIILPFICVSLVWSKDLSLWEVHLSWKISSSSPTSLSSPFLFSLCGVEGIGVLPQVAEATDAAATSLVRHSMQRKGRQAGAAAAVQSSTATCGCKNCFIYPRPHLLPPPPSPCGCWSWRALRERERLRQRVQSFQ